MHPNGSLVHAYNEHGMGRVILPVWELASANKKDGDLLPIKTTPNALERSFCRIADLDAWDDQPCDIARRCASPSDVSNLAGNLFL